MTTADEAKRPSEVFAERLREMRDDRRFSQAELAQRMTDGGRPLSKVALLRIESGDRGIALDEAIALTRLLHAVPAQMLTLPEGAMTALTANDWVDGGGMHNWLVYGEPILQLSVLIDAEGTEPRAVLRGRLEQDITTHALALADAFRVKDTKAITVAGDAIVRTVETYRETIERGNYG
jgi:transcriptional regulator with XRE-family HTH domain